VGGLCPLVHTACGQFTQSILTKMKDYEVGVDDAAVW